MRGNAVGLSRAFFFACLLSATALPTWGQPVCEPPGQYLAWPSDEPIWRLCAVRPRDSGGPAGSGLELRNVYFRGRKVLTRAQVPISAVDHPVSPTHSESPEPESSEPGSTEPGAQDLCAGRCFRTWTREEVPFATSHEISPGYYEPTSPAQTSCDRVLPSSEPATAGKNLRAPGRCPWGEALACAPGIAAESEGDRWILTTEVAAGWYRYTLRWIFHRDGRIEARAGAQSDAESCAHTAHVHHLLWRLDFDFAFLQHDQILTSQGALLRTEGVRRRIVDGDEGWIVRDGKSGRGYRVIPGSSDEPQSTGDLAVTLYEPLAERAPKACAIDLRELVQDRLLGGGDPVIWYRSAGSVQPDAPYRCTLLGPTLEPVGNWPLPGAVLFEDGFESGDMSAWSSVLTP